MTPPIRTRPDGTRYPLDPGGGRRGGGPVVAVLAVVALAGAGGAAGAGGLGTAGAGASSTASDTVAGSLPDNLSGDVVDSLPGRKLGTRRAEARNSARRGRPREAWSRLKLTQLVRRVEHAAEHQVDCVAAASGEVRAFLERTPCTSLDRVLLAVGDGQGNAAVVSVVRIGFRTAAEARDFQQIEDVQGSGDVRPLDIAALLHLTGVAVTAEHYHSRIDRRATIVAEADTATGHLDGAVLDAIAETASYLPLT